MKLIWAAAIGLLAATTVPAHADTSDVGRYVNEYIADASYPGVTVVITKGDRVIEATGYGHDSTGAPMTGKSKMAVASVSKSFTSLAVMQLVEAGKIDLDRPVRTYLPDFRVADPRGERITVRHLLAHTSGITDGTLKEKSLPQPDDLAGAVERAHQATLAADPGAVKRYTNTNYHLAGRVVEVVSGEPFNDYLRRHVFEPAGMRDTTAITETTRDLPAGYVRGHGYVYGMSVAMAEPPRFVAASDGVISTAEDMGKWLTATGLVSAEGMKTLREQGLGWETGSDGRVRHSGIWFTGTAGQVITRSGYGVAVMANSGINLGNEGTFALENGVLDVLEGRTPPAPSSWRLATDLVVAALTLLSLGLGIRALRRSPKRRNGWWQLPRFVPLVILVFLPALLSAVYGGRDISFYQLAHYALPLVVWLGVSSVLNVSVAVKRWRR